MKKLLTLLFLFAFFVALMPQAAPVHAQGNEFPAELAYYDAQIDVMYPHLQEFQQQYHDANGIYYQALDSHYAVPDVPTLPDGLNDAPTDQPETLALFWETYAALPPELSWSFRIDTYSGPDGDGYVLTISTYIYDMTWTRSINYGPETYRSYDWYPVVPFEF